MNKSITLQTSNAFKLLYVIAILMVIDGHIGSFDYLNFNGFFSYQNYHIALFMFTSGYFLNLNRSYKEFFVRKFTHLIVHLYIWNLVYGILCFILNNYFNFRIGQGLSFYSLFYAPLIDGHQFIFNMASWFLVPLFFVQILCFVCLKSLNKRKNTYKTAGILLFIVALTLSYFVLPYANNNKGNASVVLLLFRCIYFLPIFSFGFVFRHSIEKYDNKVSSCIYFVCIALLLTLVYQLYPNYRHTPSWLNDINVSALVIYFICFLSILFWVRIAKIFSPIISKSKLLQYLSNNTFNLMMHHFVGFMIVKSLLSKCENFDWYRYKTDIWYYFFFDREQYVAWIYIFITIVIALFIGFTYKKIYSKIKSILTKILYLVK